MSLWLQEVEAMLASSLTTTIPSTTTSAPPARWSIRIAGAEFAYSSGEGRGPAIHHLIFPTIPWSAMISPSLSGGGVTTRYQPSTDDDDTGSDLPLSYQGSEFTSHYHSPQMTANELPTVEDTPVPGRQDKSQQLMPPVHTSPKISHRGKSTSPSHQAQEKALTLIIRVPDRCLSKIKSSPSQVSTPRPRNKCFAPFVGQQQGPSRLSSKPPHVQHLPRQKASIGWATVWSRLLISTGKASTLGQRQRWSATSTTIKLHKRHAWRQANHANRMIWLWCLQQREVFANALGFK